MSELGMRARCVAPLRARKPDCSSRRQECHGEGENASRKPDLSGLDCDVPSRLRSLTVAWHRPRLGSLEQQLPGFQSEKRVTPVRCHLDHGTQDEVAAMHGRVGQCQPGGGRLPGLAGDGATADADDVDVERARPPSRPRTAAGGALENLQSSQSAGRRKRTVDPHHAIAVAWLADGSDWPADDDARGLGDAKPEVANLRDRPVESCLGRTPRSPLVGP